jgi:hypothetical protein
MGTHLATFATWLRQDMSLPDGIEIVIDRAATPIGRKQRPTTRWDHLAKQQSFTMPKVPSRRRLGDTIEEDTATERAPLSARRMIKQTSFSLPRGGTGRRLGDDDDEGAARPGMGVKQTSMSSLPRSYDRQTSFNKLTKNEQMNMPRLVKQCSFKSLPRRLCDDDQSVGSRPCMQKEGSLSLSKRRSRPRRPITSSGGPEPNHRPKLPVRKDSSDETTDTLSSMPRLAKQTSLTVAKLSSRGPLIGDNEMDGKGMPRRPARTFDSEDEQDEKTDTLSSMPQLIKQTSFTVASLSSRGPLIGDNEKGGNGTDRRRQMIKQDSFTMPRRPTRTVDSDDEKDEKTDTLSSMPRLVKQPSFTISKLSSRGPFIGNDEKGENGIAFTMHRRPTRTFDSEDEQDEKTDTLSSIPRVVKQPSFTISKLSSRGPHIGSDEKGGNGIDRRRQMVKQDSFTMPRRPTRTFDSDDEKHAKTDTLSSTRQLAKQMSFTVAKLQGQQCSTEARLLFIYTTIAEALEVSEDVMDDVCEERDSLAMPMRQARSI